MGATKVTRDRIAKLFLQGGNVRGRAVVARLVPQGNEGLVKGAVEGHEVDPGTQRVRLLIRGIVCRRGQRNRSRQGHGPLALQRIRSTEGISSRRARGGDIEGKNVPFGNKEQPVETAATSSFGDIALQIRFLLVQAHDEGEGGGLAQVEPGLVVQVEGVIAGKEEIAGAEGVQAGRLGMVVILAHAQRFLDEQRRGDEVGAGQALETQGIPGHAHARLKEGKGAEGGPEAVDIGILIDVGHLRLQARAVEDGQGGVEVGEVEIKAAAHQLRRQQAGRRGNGGRNGGGGAGGLGGEGGMALSLAQFTDDLGAGAFGTFLLGNGVVGTGELGRGAIATRIDTVALDFAPMAGIAGAFDRGGEFGKGGRGSGGGGGGVVVVGGYGGGRGRGEGGGGGKGRCSRRGRRGRQRSHDGGRARDDKERSGAERRRVTMEEC